MAGNSPFATEREANNKALMEGTATIHREAERRPFMVAMFQGTLPKDAYVAYLGRLAYVYEALEETGVALKDDPDVGPIWSDALVRLPGIEADMTAFLGPDWRQRLTPTPATKAYADRIREVGESFPKGYAVHHWLRYLGYLLGQDVIRKYLYKAYGEDCPVAFYDFPQIEDRKGFLGGYHAAMNAIELSPEELARFVEEGNRAFQLQIDLTDELGEEFGFTAADAEEAEQLMDKLAKEHG
ncbi:MAG TPA: biliverdin-producing heme oxygenase [Actinomycetota bacterium]